MEETVRPQIDIPNRPTINATYSGDKIKPSDGAFNNANQSFCYQQWQQQSVRNFLSALCCSQVSAIIESTLLYVNLFMALYNIAVSR
jgi:hypothetical protein